MTDVPELLMFDSVTPTAIPKGARMVAGYVNGSYPDYAQLLKLFPDARVVSITVRADEPADVLDVERGDATPAQVPQWVTRMRQGLRRPIVYCSLSMMGEIEAACAAVKVSPPFYWSADWTGKPHLNSGCVATQYASPSVPDPRFHANVDVSLVSPNFPDRYQTKPKKGHPTVKLPTKAQLIADLLHLASALAIVSAAAPQLHLPPWARGVLAAAALVTTRALGILRDKAPAPTTTPGS